MKKTQRSWNSTLRTKSPKRAKQDRQTTPARKAYKAEFLMCHRCCKRPATDTHEIARGTHKAAAMKEPCTWLALCRTDHDEMGDYSIWPVARQLALKLVADPNRFDLKKFNKLRGRNERAITLDEVTQYLELKDTV